MKSVAFSVVCSGAWASVDRAAMVEQIQNTPGVLWTAAVSSNLGPLKPLMGVTDQAMRDRAKFAAGQNKTLTGAALPERFESHEQWPHCAKVILDIRDQSNCGCCWAFAAASAASDRLCISSKAAYLQPLSAEDICFCASYDGCNGGDIETPWNHMKFGGWLPWSSGPGAVTGGQYKGTGPFGSGMCSDFSLPHCHHHGPQRDDPYPPEGAAGCPSASSPSCPTECDSTAKAPHNNFKQDKLGFKGDLLSLSGEESIAQAIMEGGPMETAFTVYEDFANYVGGIYHYVSGNREGGHAVRFVGWGVENGQKYWKVANSWNPYWGEKGYFRIKKGNNECGIEDQATGSSASASWGKKSDLVDDVVV